MRILLVGHRGYLGSGLARALGERHEVIGWGSDDDVTTITPSRLRELAPDAVVNCAVAYDRASSVIEVGSATDRVNVSGARALVEALRHTSVRLVQISSKDVFGPVYGPGDVVERPTRYEPLFAVDERQPFDPRTAYAKSKLIAEFIAESHPLSTTIRLSSILTDLYHPRGAWILQMIRAAVQGEPVTIEGSGKQVRDPLHVDDVAQLIERVLGADGATVGRLKLNAGGGSQNLLSVQEVVDLIGTDVRVREAPGGDLGFAFDNGLAERVLGWRPRVFVRDRIGPLRQTVEAVLANTRS